MEQGRRLAEYNRRKMEELKKGFEQRKVDSEQVSSYSSSQYYGIGVLILIGIIGYGAYYINHKESPSPKIEKSQAPVKQVPNKFEME